jgi:predicted permease
MSHLLQDLRFGIRVLLRNRGFTTVAIAALALGIGANSAIFSVIYGVLLKPLPYVEPERLVRVYENNPVERFQMFPLSPADFLDYRKENRVFQGIATYVRQDQQYGGERPERLVGARVSHGFFRLFGAEPMLGRAFTEEEEATSGATGVAIISHGAWMRLLGGDPRVLGRTIMLTGDPFRVVGVMPPGFEHVGGYRLPPGEEVEVWLPFNKLESPRGVPRAFHYCNTIARLKPGVKIEEAEAEMNVIARRLEAQFPDDKDWRIQLKVLQDDLVGKTRPTLLILAGAVGFVLLIACVNVANLLLARAAARGREMAIRSAVGATRARLVRQMLTESVTLAALGGALGLLLAYWSVRALAVLGPEQVPRLHAISLDVRVVLVTAVTSVLAGVLFGLAPALAASTDLRRSRPRGVFVIVEIALTFVLLMGAGLLFRSFLSLERVDPGFNTRGVLTMNTALSYQKLVGARQYAAFYERFVESLAQLPGVTAAGASSNLPWTGANDSALFGIEGRPRPANLSMNGHYQFVSPEYLQAIGVPLLAGRWLTTSDHFDAPKVVLVNKTLALQYWPAVEASVGHRIYTMRDANTVDSPMTIVGVVGDVKDSPADAQAQAAFYVPFLQSPSFGNYIALRTTADAAALIPAVRQVAQQMGNDLSIQEIRPMEQMVEAAVATQRFALQMVGVFAVVALALALIGIYGVMSYAASRRAREIAIRTALGARRVDTLRLLLGQGVQLIVAGLIAGALAAAGLTRVLAGILYQVSATDPLTFAAVAAILAAVAIAACFEPARKALSGDPIKILRHE